MIDATAVAKGKGFAGAMKRHNFSGQGAAHGNHKHHRAPGSIGACATPGRVFKGTKMAGRMGGGQVTTTNLEVISRRRRAPPRPRQGCRPGPARRRRRAAYLGEEPDEGRRCTMSDVFTLRGPDEEGPTRARQALGRRASRSTVPHSARVELEPTIFGIEPNMAVLHQVIKAQLAAKRSGTQSTKTRKEVRGGGKKPFNQKGTGGARQGTIRAPHYPGGGIALGPKPRKYDQKTPKKMIRLALYSALSDRAVRDRVAVVDSFATGRRPGPRTHQLRSSALGPRGQDPRRARPRGRDGACVRSATWCT